MTNTMKQVKSLKANCFLFCMICTFVCIIIPVQAAFQAIPYAFDLSDAQARKEGIQSNLFDYLALEDSSGKLSIKDVISPPVQSRFTSIHSFSAFWGPLSHYWVKLSLRNASLADRWVLEVQSLHTPVVEVFIKNEKGEYIRKVAGHTMPFNQKQDYKVKNIVFELPFYDQADTDVYLRIKAHKVKDFYFKVHTTASLVEYTVNEYILLGMYYGILLIIAVYNLALFITTRELVNILYVPYILSCIVSSLTEDGLGFAYVWPDHPSYNILINYTLAPLALLISFMVYSRKFLDLPKYHKQADRFLLGVTGAYVVFWFITEYTGWWTPFSQIVYLIPFACLYVVSIYVYWKGFKPARYYIMAYTLICLAILIGVLRLIDVVDPSIWTVYSFNIGLVTEACVMSYAIGDKFRIIKKEQEQTQGKLIQELERNSELQDKVNKELEQKVEERTNELKNANVELAKLSEELQVMNSKLDYDNWNLKKKIDEEKRESLLSKVVDFEDFKVRFPNEYTCQTYIENIKWQDGFKCKKCGHEKYNTPGKTLSRKCTRCDHVESVTADTLFHGTRFPLVKAFYIIHIVVNDIKDIHIEELARKLELAKNTCWKFRKKVEERLKELKKKNIKVSSWEVLIRNID